MSLVTELKERLRALVHRRREDRELDEELRFHLEMEVEENLRRGMGPEEARRQANLRLGGLTQVREAARDARGLRWFEDLVADLRHGVRLLRRSPGFTLVAVLTLAVGIGAATAVFSLANAVLLRPAAGVRDADRLAHLRLRAPHLEDEERGLSYPNFLDLAGMDLPGIEALTGWTWSPQHIAVPGKATAVLFGAAVAGDYFGTLGVRPAEGRLFGASETELGRAEPMVVLSERARAQLFGAEPAVGRTVLVNGIPLAVVGVAADGFRGVYRSGEIDLWVPYGTYPRLLRIAEEHYLRRASGHLGEAVVRLAPGVTAEAAEAVLRAAAGRLVSAYPAENTYLEDYRPTLFPDVGLSPWTAGRTRRTMAVLLGAVSLVLLIACANVANLLVFRGVRRQGESAVRQALGASRLRLLRQHLAESGLLAAGGVALGLALTAAAVRLFAGAGMTPVGAVRIDVRVVGFAAAAGAAAVLLAGLAPALAVHRIELVRSLQAAAPTATGRRRRLRAGLTVAQLALSLALLVSALLLVRTVRGLHAVQLGFEPDGLVRVVIDPQRQGYDDARANAFQREVLLGLGALPGAASAGLASGGPLRAHLVVDLRPEGFAGEDWPVEAFADHISPGYFEAAGIPVQRGRGFTMSELEASWRKESDVVVLNETLARRLFGAADPVGRTIVLRGARGAESLRVVGVVADSRTRTLDAPIAAALYRPLGAHYSNAFSIFVRSAAPPADVVAAVRALVDRLDPALPFSSAGPASDVIAQETAEERFMARLMSLLAALAALLAGIGLYGVVAYSVAERTREIGVRIALGARGAQVVGLVVRQSLAFAVAGLALGAGVGWAFARMLEGHLFGVAPLDPATWLTAAAAFGALALLAAVAPARAAARVDPVRALKS